MKSAQHHLQVDVEAAVETRPAQLLASAPHLTEVLNPQFQEAHHQYLQPSPHVDWDGVVASHTTDLISGAGDDAMNLVLSIYRRAGSLLTYTNGVTSVGTPLDEVLRRGEGVCQDYAHLAVAMCRAAKIPARYVSGYFFAADDSTGAETADSTVHVQTHAWFEAALPNSGWLALDPTNLQQVGERHIKIGHGRDYDDVPPLRGVYSGDATPELTVDVELRRSDSQQQQQQQQ